MPKLSDQEKQEFIKQFEQKGGDISLALGLQPVEIEKDHAVMTMPFSPNTSQVTGVFAAGALVTLADVTATWACNQNNEEGTFPLAVQLSVNLMRSANTGNATATAKVVHSGRTMKVAETVVTDDNDKVLTRVTSTHLVTQIRK